MIKYYSLILIFLISIHISAQESILIAPYSIIEGDTFFVSNISEVKVLEFKNIDERKEYHILKRRVLKVYPYALEAKNKLYEMQKELDSIYRKRNKKRYAKKIAKWVKEKYGKELKNLTISEGKILVKLIYRETNTTSYDILKSFRGSFNAFFWQTIAKLWDNNLKTEYDPINIREDMLIDYILLHNNIENKLE